MNGTFVPGATWLGDDRCRFVVWAPDRKVELHLLSPRERWVPLSPAERGYHEAVVEGVEPGSRYRLRVGGRDERPDPASAFQPEGVHGPSEVDDPRFPWTDAGWTGLPLERYVIYEIHVGTFTPEGTFDGAIRELDGLRDLGITAIELMPVAQFPGSRNWGYDGVFPYSVQNTYGGPRGLRRFVDACHARGMAVVLDVVYNHLGPEGNPLWGLAPYFTEAYRTPWGAAINFDGPWSDEVRSYFIGSAIRWIRDFHVDALRLDAVHAIVDSSARPFLQELAGEVRALAEALGRRVYLIAESDRNDPRLVASPERGGMGLSALWNDDFHHALHGLLTGEKEGYYRDFGTLGQLGRALTEGFVYAGEYSAFRGRRHGASSARVRGEQLVVFAQNHDQVGNRPRGERLASLVSFEELKLAAGAVLMAPNVPLFFMGEEYGETAPFLYFVSHGDPALVDAVRRGRAEEARRWGVGAEVPDPQAEETFLRSKLDRTLGDRPRGRALREYLRAFLELRRRLPPLARLSKEGTSVRVLEEERVLLVHRRAGGRVLGILNFARQSRRVALPAAGGSWVKELDSADSRWGGPGTRLPDTMDLGVPVEVDLPPSSVAVYSSPEPPVEGWASLFSGA